MNGFRKQSPDDGNLICHFWCFINKRQADDTLIQAFRKWACSNDYTCGSKGNEIRSGQDWLDRLPVNENRVGFLEDIQDTLFYRLQGFDGDAAHPFIVHP